MFVRVSVPVFPSEDPKKVEQAVRNIFPDAVLEVEDGRMEGTADLDHFSNLIRRQKILDTARSVMFKGQRGEDRTVFSMNKQVAFAGKISFTEERTILGAIRVTVEDDNVAAFIDMIAPNTVDGEEVKI